MGPTPKPIMQRFLSKVVKTPTCWVWMGATNNNYGQLYDNKVKKHRRAHILAYELFIGPVPDGLNICHRCDVRSCVNPKHLFAASQGDNLKDMYGKKRRHGAKKLTWAKVKEIRRLRRLGRTTYSIGQKFAIAHQTVSEICLGKYWRVG